MVWQQDSDHGALSLTAAPLISWRMPLNQHFSLVTGSVFKEKPWITCVRSSSVGHHVLFPVYDPFVWAEHFSRPLSHLGLADNPGDYSLLEHRKERKWA